MEVEFQLVVVAFVRSAGGQVRVLLAIDREGVQLHEGEPVLLASVRPHATDPVVVEGPDEMDPERTTAVSRYAGERLRAMVESAFDEQGSLAAERLLGRSATWVGPPEWFDL